MKGPGSFETLICISNVFYARPETQQSVLQYKKALKWRDLLDDKD